jgi:hypothetical protein
MKISNSRICKNICNHSLKIPSLFALVLIFTILLPSCKKDDNKPHPDPSDNLAIDSLIASKTDIKVWEQISINAYTRGQNLAFKWSANHGSMSGKDSSAIKYWACPSCVGLNTIKCTVSNEFGSLSDTIMINVH